MKNKTALPKFNLQLFAEEGTEETPPADEQTEGTEQTTEDQEEKIFKQEDVNEIVKKRLTKERAKFEEDFKTKLALEKKEAERLAKLSEDDREKEVLRLAKEELENERLTFQREKLELQVTKELAEKGLPITFAKLLVTKDADTSLENIKLFEKDWQEALEKAVVEKLKGTSPRAGEAVETKSYGLGKRLAEQRNNSSKDKKENPYF